MFHCSVSSVYFRYAEHRSRSHDAVIRVYDESGAVIETHEQQKLFSHLVKIPLSLCCHAAHLSERCDLPRSTLRHLVRLTCPRISIAAVANLLFDRTCLDYDRGQILWVWNGHAV